MLTRALLVTTIPRFAVVHGCRGWWAWNIQLLRCLCYVCDLRMYIELFRAHTYHATPRALRTTTAPALRYLPRCRTLPHTATCHLPTHNAFALPLPHLPHTARLYYTRAHAHTCCHLPLPALYRSTLRLLPPTAPTMQARAYRLRGTRVPVDRRNNSSINNAVNAVSRQYYYY